MTNDGYPTIFEIGLDSLKVLFLIFDIESQQVLLVTLKVIQIKVYTVMPWIIYLIEEILRLFFNHKKMSNEDEVWRESYMYFLAVLAIIIGYVRL